MVFEGSNDGSHTDRLGMKQTQNMRRGAMALCAALTRAVVEAEADLNPWPPATRIIRFRPKNAFQTPERARTMLAADRSIEVDFHRRGDLLMMEIYSVGAAAMRRHAGRKAELRSRNPGVVERFTFDSQGLATFALDARRANDALSAGFVIEVALRHQRKHP